MVATAVNVVFCWHMHQPYYREGLGGKFQLPWVYLHALKDYTDMVAHLENHPGVRLVVNFAPILLEQLQDYSNQLDKYLSNGKSMDDPMLNMLAGVTPIPTDTGARIELIKHCQRCYAPKMIEPWPAFNQLVTWVNSLFATEEANTNAELASKIRYLDDQCFVDLLVWYHLSWLGHSIKPHPTAQRLLEKANIFSPEDRLDLIELIHDSIAGIIPRYKKLSDQGQIELAMTPFGHPIIPLLTDFSNMRCATPHAPAPAADIYPGGVERAAWHMEHGFKVFEQAFDHKPHGIWLSEGGVSPDAFRMLDNYGITWTASGEAVWHNSCQLAGFDEKHFEDKRSLFIPYQYQDCANNIYFRDDGLSDLIGFEYSKWDPKDAAANFTHNLENIAKYLGDEADQHVVSVILDGENAWEYFDDNAYHFLDTLYQSLESSKLINTTTFADANKKLKPFHIDKFCSGSWVYGSFSTWIGHEEKNRAWELLVHAKQAYDEVVHSLPAKQRHNAELQLAICEGSDWFWWFGDHNPSDSVIAFDKLYRLQLGNLYELLGRKKPDELDEPISSGGHGAENAGTMKRNA